MILRRFPRIVFGVLGVLASGLLMTGAAGSQPAFAANLHRIQNYDGKFLDMTNGSMSNGAQPQLWTYNGSDQQFWEFKLVPGTANVYLIENFNSSKCLSILDNDTSAGAEVIQYNCDFSGGDLFETWILYVPSGAPSGYFWLLNVGDNFVMHPAGCRSDDGTKMYMNVGGQCNADYWRLQ